MAPEVKCHAAGNDFDEFIVGAVEEDEEEDVEVEVDAIGEEVDIS